MARSEMEDDREALNVIDEQEIEANMREEEARRQEEEVRRLEEERLAKQEKVSMCFLSTIITKGLVTVPFFKN